MAQGSIQGRFVWQELTTEDPSTAVAFYSKVVGWHAHPNPSHPTYTEFGIGSSHTAGMMALTDDARAAGVRSNWQSYIGASDVDSTAAAAEKLGGKVVHPATDIAQVGRFATLNDPQGGVFAIFKPSGAGGGSAPSAVVAIGAFAWLELATSDYEAAFEFYSKLFGWQVMHRMDMGPQGTYLIFGADGVQIGGMYKMHAERASRPYWLPYAEVANADAAATAATGAGGRIIVGPMDVPGGGRMAQVLDPSGAMFALHSAAAPSKPAAKPAVSKPAVSKPAVPKPAAAMPQAAKPAAAKEPAAPAKLASAVAAVQKPAAKKAAPKKAAPKKAAGKKPAAKKKAAARKKPAAKKKAAKKASGKKAGARKTAAKSARKSAKKTARKAARKAAGKSRASKRKPAKARRKK
jgi:predicted enzyme related to lactoylglutathione lyase